GARRGSPRSRPASCELMPPPARCPKVPRSRRIRASSFSAGSFVFPTVGQGILRDLVEQNDALRGRLGEEPSLPDLRLPLPVELDRESPGSHPLLVELSKRDNSQHFT